MGPRSPDSPVFGDPAARHRHVSCQQPHEMGGDNELHHHDAAAANANADCANHSACGNDNSSSVATPSSVHLTGSVLTRDLSDLSGSYMNGNHSPLTPNHNTNRNNVPRNIFGSPSRESPLTIRQPWRQAFSLSNPAPDVKHNNSDNKTKDAGVVGPVMPILSPSTSCAEGQDGRDLILVEQNGGVEVMPPGLVEQCTTTSDSCSPDDKMPLDWFLQGSSGSPASPTSAARATAATALSSHHERLPVVIVLMNPCYKTYELMQLWLDAKADTVRQVLHTLRQALPSTWSQDYDGLAQFRRNRLSQLINCLRIQQFEVVPYEIWVAKPWALSAQKTFQYADNLLEHLRKVGVVTLSTGADSPRRGGGSGDEQCDERVMTLSSDAKGRIHAPDGIMTHHHAIQYLSFSPPFEKPFDKPPVFPKLIQTGAATAVGRSVSVPSPSSLASPTKNNTGPTAVAASAHGSPPSSSQYVIEHHVVSDGSTTGSPCYPEINIESGGLLVHSRGGAPIISPLSSRAVSPDFSAKSVSSLHFSTDSSTEESQMLWDDGTVKVMSSMNLGEGRFSLQSLASQYDLTLSRRRSSATAAASKQRTGRGGKRSVGRLKTLFSGLSCKQKRANAVETGRGKPMASEEFTANLSFGHDDKSLTGGGNGGQHMLTLFEVDSAEERSMADMPLLNSSRDKIAFEKDVFDDEYAA